VYTWCQESYKQYPQGKDEEIGDKEDTDIITTQIGRMMRGGSFSGHTSHVRSAYRTDAAPVFHHDNVGFRPARTITP
jgi:formylglycine-generating enzyme required for sulfatase activity